MTTETQGAGRAHNARNAALVTGVLTIGFAIAAALLPAIDWAPRARIVGWLLFAAGVLELGFGAARSDSVRATAMVSGILTIAAGLIFILNPFAPYLPVANLVMLWLLLRGAWLLGRATMTTQKWAAQWLALSGLFDVLLGLLLASGLPTALLVTALFGPTPEIVAKFSFVLATSFLTTGIAQLAISATDREAAGKRLDR